MLLAEGRSVEFAEIGLRGALGSRALLTERDLKGSGSSKR